MRDEIDLNPQHDSEQMTDDQCDPAMRACRRLQNSRSCSASGGMPPKTAYRLGVGDRMTGFKWAFIPVRLIKRIGRAWHVWAIALVRPFASVAASPLSIVMRARALGGLG